MTRLRLAMTLGSGAMMDLPQPANRTTARERIADMIARLVDMLDEIDGEPDQEDEGSDEPSLGWTSTMALGTYDDRELADDLEA